jgi:hypothetical protein
MRTMTMTEFNQAPSKAARYADVEDVVIERYGQPTYRLTRIVSAPLTIKAALETGLATPPQSLDTAGGLPVFDTASDAIGLALAERDAR